MVEDEHEPQVQPEVGDAESEASTSSFDSPPRAVLIQVKNLMTSQTQITIHLGIVRWL